MRADPWGTPTTELRAGDQGTEGKRQKESLETNAPWQPKESRSTKGKINGAKRNREEDQKILKGVASKEMYFRM